MAMSHRAVPVTGTAIAAGVMVMGIAPDSVPSMTKTVVVVVEAVDGLDAISSHIF